MIVDLYVSWCHADASEELMMGWNMLGTLMKVNIYSWDYSISGLPLKYPLYSQYHSEINIYILLLLWHLKFIFLAEVIKLVEFYYSKIWVNVIYNINHHQENNEQVNSALMGVICIQKTPSLQISANATSIPVPSNRPWSHLPFYPTHFITHINPLISSDVISETTKCCW
jgi:hypothetical protein